MQLNEQAKIRATAPPLQIHAPNRTLPWAPMELGPVSHLPSFRQLSDLQKLRYNQLFALGILEQFIWFEEGLLCPILGRLGKTDGLTAELRRALEIFISEE